MKIAIVTGASSGMGREFVRQLHHYVQPDAIWAIARRKSALEALSAETPIPVRPIVLDLGCEDAFREFAALLEAETGLKVVLWDERRTTIDAHHILYNAGKNAKKRKKVVDAVAASLILEGYLTRLKQG